MVRVEGRGVVNVFVCNRSSCGGVSRGHRRLFIGGAAAGACRVFYVETTHTKLKLLSGGRKVHRPPATRRMPRLDGLQFIKRAALDGEGPAQCIN